MAFEVVTKDETREHVLARCVAEEADEILEAIGVGRHGFVVELDPAEQLDYEVLHNRQVILDGIARDWSRQLADLGISDGRHAFRVLLCAPITYPTALQVRIKDTSILFPIALALVTTFQPMGHVAMDITDNCNLRCKFCTFDHASVSSIRMMSE